MTFRDDCGEIVHVSGCRLSFSNVFLLENDSRETIIPLVKTETFTTPQLSYVDKEVDDSNIAADTTDEKLFLSPEKEKGKKQKDEIIFLLLSTFFSKELSKQLPKELSKIIFDYLFLISYL
jgi:hypothetical protein